MKINLKKNKVFDYLKVFAISFLIGIFAGKLAVPINPSYAINSISVNENSETASTLEKEPSFEETEIKEIASANAHTASASSYVTNANNNSSYANNGLYIPNLGFYSYVSNANVSGNTIAVPASGVAKYGNLLIGHNPGTFSAILGIHANDIIYLYGQAYQVYYVGVQDVSDNMKFVGTETTSSLSDGSKGLVLMTCYGNMKTFANGVTSATQRFLVYARAI
jgi:hypothetical protein